MPEQQTANGNGVHIKTRWGTLDAKRGSELIAIVCLILMGATGWGAWTLGLKLADAMAAMAAEQRRMTCVVSLKQEERESAFANPNSFCNRIAQ